MSKLIEVHPSALGRDLHAAILAQARSLNSVLSASGVPSHAELCALAPLFRIPHRVHDMLCIPQRVFVKEGHYVKVSVAGTRYRPGRNAVRTALVASADAEAITPDASQYKKPKEAHYSVLPNCVARLISRGLRDEDRKVFTPEAAARCAPAEPNIRWAQISKNYFVRVNVVELLFSPTRDAIDILPKKLLKKLKARYKSK